jgi:hypothetical protein
MDHDLDTRPEATPPEATPPNDRPADWDRKEVRADFGDDADATPTTESPDVADWNEGQMARERPDGTREPGPSDDEIASSKGGLSGGGSNPGGGERWAERDKEA